MDNIAIGLVSVSDRASAGVYADEGIPALKAWLNSAILNPVEWHERLISDEQEQIKDVLIELTGPAECNLVFTTGGTGPAQRDVTPDATLAVAERELPGFAEQMRRVSLHFVPTAILSRQVAVIRNGALIVNLPGQPKAIAETLGGFQHDDPPVPGIFAAVPYCIQLLEGPYLETDAEVCKAFRPKSARRESGGSA